MKFNTKLLHKGFNGDKETGATVTPIYQVSAFKHESPEKLEKVLTTLLRVLLIQELVTLQFLLLKIE